MSVIHHRRLVPLVSAIARQNPLVMCVTNRVTPQRVADLVLASGASPAMIDNPAEVPAFASISSAVYANAGLHTTQTAALDAIQGMGRERPPLVLDPVGFGASAFRNEAILSFITAAAPDVIKGNSNEICGLAGAQGQGQGVDSAAGTAGAIEPALALSRTHNGCVVCVTGDHDIIARAGADSTADVVVRVVGDAPMMSKVTGTGCALGAIVAAGVATANDPMLGAVAAHTMYVCRSPPSQTGGGACEIPRFTPRQLPLTGTLRPASAPSKWCVVRAAGPACSRRPSPTPSMRPRASQTRSSPPLGWSSCAARSTLASGSPQRGRPPHTTAGSRRARLGTGG